MSTVVNDNIRSRDLDVPGSSKMDLETKSQSEDFKELTTKTNVEQVQLKHQLNKIQISNISEQLLVRKEKKPKENQLINEEDNRTELEKLRSYLDKCVRIKISDGRIFVGSFVCTDRDLNVVLRCTVEYLNENDFQPRMIGLITIPGIHIKSIEVEVTLPSSVQQPSSSSLPTDSVKNLNDLNISHL